jgi:hypothetical protein
VFLPRPPADVAAKRVEDEVVVQFTVPTLNTDGAGPADLRRMEVYAHTGPLPAPTDFVKYGTLVSSIDIVEPPEPKPAGEPAAEDTAPETDQAAASEAAGGAVETLRIVPKEKTGGAGVEQGRRISVREPLTEKQKEIGPLPPTRPGPPPPANAPVIERLETPGTVNFELPPMRFYTVVGVSRSRGRRGPFAGPLRVPLVEPLGPPEDIQGGYTEAAISLTWPRQPEDAEVPAPTLPGTAPLPATASAPAVAGPPLSQETEGTFELYADVETEGTQDVAPPAPPVTPAGAKAAAAARAAAAAAKAAPPPAPRFGYNVYDAAAFSAQTGPPEPPATSAAGPPPGSPQEPVAPLNAALLTAPTFSDPRVEFGTERCYVIRRVQLASGIAIESAPTRPICVTPVDTFPPAAPKNVQAISGGAGVSLLWEANTEGDLGGYLVLRGEAPGDKLSPLTPAPILDTSFNDTTVRRGRTYVYEVVAVDLQAPANQSPPSNRVEETIR